MCCDSWSRAVPGRKPGNGQGAGHKAMEAVGGTEWVVGVPVYDLHHWGDRGLSFALETPEFQKTGNSLYHSQSIY